MWPFRTRSKANHQLDARLFEVEEGLAQLRKAHERLRGAFYATRGDPSPEAESHPQSKAEVLRAMGYRPGQPFNHR
jgi:hypothetical protein